MECWINGFPDYYARNQPPTIQNSNTPTLHQSAKLISQFYSI